MENPVVDKSFEFAVRVVNLYKFLKEIKRESTMSLQLFRSGTSIGANIAESQGSQSDADIIAKLHISLKECIETRYWLKLLYRTEFLDKSQFSSIDKDASELYALIVTILKSKKAKINSPKGTNSKEPEN